MRETLTVNGKQYKKMEGYWEAVQKRSYLWVQKPIYVSCYVCRQRRLLQYLHSDTYPDSVMQAALDAYTVEVSPNVYMRACQHSQCQELFRLTPNLYIKTNQH